MLQRRKKGEGIQVRIDGSDLFLVLILVMRRLQERNREHEEFSSGFKRRGTLVSFDHALCCVHFPPGGNTIIVRGLNSNEKVEFMTFSFHLWGKKD